MADPSQCPSYIWKRTSINWFKLINDKSDNTDAIQLSIFTWNIEGWKRNCLNLEHFISKYKPDLVFLSEPQCFQCDISALFQCFQGLYCFSLNSSDVMCPDLPLDTRKAFGGTMVMWRSNLGPYIKLIPTTTTAVLPVIVSLPGFAVTAHVAIYLPTSGK